MGPQRSAVVAWAIWLTIGAIAMTGVTALLTFVFKDELIDAWAADRSDAGSVEPPAFVPVAVTMFVVVALLAAVLVAFFREGHNWARILLSALIVLIAASTIAILRTNPPTLFLVVAVVSLAIDVAAVVALWHKDTREFCSEPADLSAALTRALTALDEVSEPGCTVVMFEQMFERRPAGTTSTPVPAGSGLAGAGTAGVAAPGSTERSSDEPVRPARHHPRLPRPGRGVAERGDRRARGADPLRLRPRRRAAGRGRAAGRPGHAGAGAAPAAEERLGAARPRSRPSSASGRSSSPAVRPSGRPPRPARPARSPSARPTTWSATPTGSSPSSSAPSAWCRTRRRRRGSRRWRRCAPAAVADALGWRP